MIEKMDPHTPGPWRVDDERYMQWSDGDFASVRAGDGNGVIVCELRGQSPYRDGEGMANADLIASAPDLLAATRRLQAQVEGLREALKVAAPIITDMQLASDAVDQANGTSDYVTRITSLGLIARHLLREFDIAAALAAAEAKP